MKANATLSGHAAARNPISPVSDVLRLSHGDFVHPGLISHPTLSPSVQVQILSIVDVTGSASIGDIITELPGHADPVGAIFALIAADVLVVLTAGIIDAHAIVARSGNGNHGIADGQHPARHVDPASCIVSQAVLDAETEAVGNGLPVAYSAFAKDSLPENLLLVPSSPLMPKIVMGPGWRRAAFKHLPVLQRHGVYIMLRSAEAYVGYGADVGARIAAGRQMPDGAPDTVIAIVDAENALSDEDARALERILWSSVAGDTDYSLINGVPDGAAVDIDRYGQLALFVSQVVLALRQAGVMFLNGSVRERLAGPRTEPDRLGAARRFDDLPEGRVRELNYCGLTALAAERDDGSWLLLRGSDVRIETVSSASASASYQRTAWLHAGLLEVANDASCYVLKRDMVFSSGSAVGNFCSGSKGFGPSSWRAIDPDEDELALAC